MNIDKFSLRVKNALVDSNVAPNLAADVAKQVTEQIEDECGGLTLYVSKNRINKANLKREQIIAEFTGNNHKQLAKIHNISIVHVYRLLKEHKQQKMEVTA